jgi:hypothetical protein
MRLLSLKAWRSLFSVNILESTEFQPLSQP